MALIKGKTPATTWRDKAVLARGAEMRVTYEADRLLLAERPHDVYAGSYNRQLRVALLAVAQVHAEAAYEYECAFASAAEAEMT